MFLGKIAQRHLSAFFRNFPERPRGEAENVGPDGLILSPLGGDSSIWHSRLRYKLSIGDRAQIRRENEGQPQCRFVRGIVDADHPLTRGKDRVDLFAFREKPDASSRRAVITDIKLTDLLRLRGAR